METLRVWETKRREMDDDGRLVDRMGDDDRGPGDLDRMSGGCGWLGK